MVKCVGSEAIKSEFKSQLYLGEIVFSLRFPFPHVESDDKNNACTSGT